MGSRCVHSSHPSDVLCIGYQNVVYRSYSTEADVWSIGVITYILLCGSRPFWARTESGIFRAVIRADPSFDEMPWPSVSPEAKDFVKRLLSKDLRKRMTAAQALSKSQHVMAVDNWIVYICRKKYVERVFCYLD